MTNKEKYEINKKAVWAISSKLSEVLWQFLCGFEKCEMIWTTLADGEELIVIKYPDGKDELKFWFNYYDINDKYSGGMRIVKFVIVRRDPIKNTIQNTYDIDVSHLEYENETNEEYDYSTVGNMLADVLMRLFKLRRQIIKREKELL